jgi:predicted DNA binding CopG/RHH family protein
MKVIRDQKNKRDDRTVTLRISEKTMQRVDEIANANDLSRQKLIAAILEQVMNDKTFVLMVK